MRWRTTATAQRAASGSSSSGLFRTAMRANDEVVVVRALPDWPAFAAFETWAAVDGWSGPPGTTSLQRTLLVDAELSPLRIGRQPAESDRRPLEEI